jgi:hypothetical protein
MVVQILGHDVIPNRANIAEIKLCAAVFRALDRRSSYLVWRIHSDHERKIAPSHFSNREHCPLAGFKYLIALVVGNNTNKNF